MMVGERNMKCPGNSRPINTKFGDNIAIEETIENKRKNVFLLNKRDGTYDELWLLASVGLVYIACKHCLMAINHSL